MEIEGVTVGQIMAVLGFVVALGGIVTYFAKVIANLKKYLTKIIVTELEPIKEQLSSLDRKVEKVDMEHCKNYLVRFLSDVEKGEPIDEIQLQRFWEEFTHYDNNGGNGYVHQKVERLKGKGLL